MALAEACTGGLTADLITDVPGCSDILYGRVIAYDNASKINLLGVKAISLGAQGAVSEQAVVAMAQGARWVLGNTYGLAVRGIAGPSGATFRKPVGTTWLGLAWEGGTTAKLLALPYDRRGLKPGARTTGSIFCAATCCLDRRCPRGRADARKDANARASHAEREFAAQAL